MTDYAPAHDWQQWESWDTSGFDASEMKGYSYQPEWHAVYTIQLGELEQTGVFDWSRLELDWSKAAYNNEQYERVCAYFLERFKFREIAIEPFSEWANALHRKLVYELMPKYKPLYTSITTGYDPTATEDERYKRRTVGSEYPETLLSGNSDYISTGTDEEWERIKAGNVAETAMLYAREFHSVDELLLDELEPLFVSMYTSYVNGF